MGSNRQTFGESGSMGQKPVDKVKTRDVFVFDMVDK